MKIGPMGCPETSVIYYKSTPRHIPEESWFHSHGGGSLEWRKKSLALTGIFCFCSLCTLSVLRSLSLLYDTHNTNIQAPGGIRTRNPRKRSAADFRIGPLGHWYRHRGSNPDLWTLCLVTVPITLPMLFEGLNLRLMRWCSSVGNENNCSVGRVSPPSPADRRTDISFGHSAGTAYSFYRTSHVLGTVNPFWKSKWPKREAYVTVIQC